MATTATAPAVRSPHESARLALTVGGAGALWIVAQAFGVLGPLGAITFPALSILTIGSILYAIKRFELSVRSPWFLIVVGLSLFFIGGVTRISFNTLGDLSGQRSLIPDLITIPGYVIAAVGFFGIIRSRQHGRENEIDTMLDAAVAALAMLTIGWLFVVNPSLVRHSPLSVRMVLAVYPTLSVFLVALTASIAFTAGTRRTVANTLFLASMLMVLMGDVVYMLVETHAWVIPATLIDLPYALGCLLLSVAVLHPSVRSITTAASATETAPGLGRLVIVAVALGIPGLITVTRVDAPVGDRITLAIIVLSLTTAAIFRLFRAVRAHARSEERLVHQATHDTLTGLPNRAYVHEYLAAAFARSRTNNTRVAVLFLDVDRFKLINDSHGHTLGDEFLIAVAERLRTGTRPTDLVARIGGDEFVIVASELATEIEAMELADHTRKLFFTPFNVHGAELASSASIGVAVADGTDRAADAESMIREADTAMYQAKESGRNAVAIFDTSMRDRVSQRLDLERDLHHALDRHELELHYQPVVDIVSGRVCGFEALIRWNHPAWGMISPLSFIPVAEETGLIVDIGGWVLETASIQMQAWRSELPGGDAMTMSVNVSARQLRDHNIVARVQRALSDSGLPRSALTLELTESALMENPAMGAEFLGRLKALGVHLAIDDFGTGYSSLAYLRRFPVDTVKIDRAFIIDLENDDSSDTTLVAAIVAMAEALGVATVAEGVETEGQAERLRELGCRVAQGYLYSRPMPVAEIPAVIDRLTKRPRARLRSVGQLRGA